MDKKICSIPPAKSASLEGSSRVSNTQLSRDSGRNGRNNSRRRFEGPVVQQTQFTGAPRGVDGGGARRPFPLKNKNVDRRTTPTPRANYSTSIASSQDREPEFGSLQSPGGRKVNVDHLLNFHLAPREQPYRAVPHHDGHQFNRSRELPKRRYHKQDFLQANSQFLVKSEGDYTVNYADCDLPIDWNSVEQVIVKSIGEPADCPICLQTPSAPKITKCGHLYCWHCILRYLAVTGTQHHAQGSAKCPVCSELFCRSDLKSVEAAVRFDVEVGDHIDMQLMMRSKNSMKIKPAVSDKVVSDWNNIFSRLILVDGPEVHQRVIAKELRELKQLRDSEEHEEERCFVEVALNELQERVEILNERFIGKSSIPDSPDAAENFVDNSSSENAPGGGESATTGLALKQYDEDDPSTLNFQPHKEEEFYFYQACDGQPIFMHPLNMAMMIRQFEDSPENWPQQISVQVIEKETHPVTTRTRDRFKVFGHLPLNSTFQLVEVDLVDIVVNDSIHEQFRNQIELRKEKRLERRKQAKRMEKLMNDRLKKGAKLADLNYPKFESIDEFPTFYIPEDNLPSLEVESSDSPIVACGSSSKNSIPDSNRTSFAEMASKPWLKRSPTFPVNAGAGTSKTSDARQRHASGGSEDRMRYNSEGNEVDDKCAPDFCSTLSDAIAKAFENVSVNDVDGAVGGGDSQPNNKGKKKKNKGKVVFSTGGATPFTQ